MSNKLANKLYLLATPLNDQGLLPNDINQQVKLLAEDGAKILVEDHKVSRRKWLLWGQVREQIEFFELYNEHNYQERLSDVLDWLLEGKNVILMSDGGYPCLADPGSQLVAKCHEYQLPMTGLNANNSIGLALMLSGFETTTFEFSGFPPRDNKERSQFFKKWLGNQRVSVILETPYRLMKTVKEIQELNPKQEFLLGINLNREDEWVKRGSIGDLLRQVPVNKGEFVLVKGI
jgi:16S rRNA (cytidine1402-2'-O)-methyltransferase